MKNFVSLVELPEHYEAYLYLIVFQHNKLMKYYLGWRKGLFDGTYKGSVTTHEEEFMSDLGKYDYKIYAIAQGTTKKMIFMENIMLNNLKKNNPQPKDYPILPSGDWKEFYNEATGGGAELKGGGTTVEDIQNGIEQGKFRTEKVNKNIIKSWKPYQVRFQHIIPGHTADIKAQLKETDGKWLNEINEETGKPNFRGVIVFEDHEGKGKHLRVGARHTITASCSKDLKQIKELKVIYIPKSLWSKLDRSDKTEIGQWDNPQRIKLDISTEHEESINFIYDSCLEKGIDPYDYTFEFKLKKQNYST
jgi:hypothetical protein